MELNQALQDWKGDKSSFPASNYITELQNLGYKVTRYGPLVGRSADWDLYIMFEKDGKPGTLQIEDSTGKYKFSYDGQTKEGTGSLKIKERLSANFFRKLFEKR